MIGGLRLPELLIILAIIVVIFGVGRIGKIGSELGTGIKGFKDSLKGKSDDAEDETKKEEK